MASKNCNFLENVTFKASKATFCIMMHQWKELSNSFPKRYIMMGVIWDIAWPPWPLYNKLKKIWHFAPCSWQKQLLEHLIVLVWATNYICISFALWDQHVSLWLIDFLDRKKVVRCPNKHKIVPYAISSLTWFTEAMDAKPCFSMTFIMMHQFGKLVVRAFQWCAWLSNNIQCTVHLNAKKLLLKPWKSHLLRNYGFWRPLEVTKVVRCPNKHYQVLNELFLSGKLCHMSYLL